MIILSSETFQLPKKNELNIAGKLQLLLMGILGEKKRHDKNTPSPKSFRFRHHMWRKKIAKEHVGVFFGITSGGIDEIMTSKGMSHMYHCGQPPLSWHEGDFLQVTRSPSLSRNELSSLELIRKWMG